MKCSRVTYFPLVFLNVSHYLEGVPGQPIRYGLHASLCFIPRASIRLFLTFMSDLIVFDAPAFLLASGGFLFLGSSIARLPHRLFSLPFFPPFLPPDPLLPFFVVLHVTAGRQLNAQPPYVCVLVSPVYRRGGTCRECE